MCIRDSISGVVLLPRQGDVLLLIDTFPIGALGGRVIGRVGLDGIAELVLLDSERGGDVLEGAGDGLGLVGRTVDVYKRQS